MKRLCCFAPRRFLSSPAAAASSMAAQLKPSSFTGKAQFYETLFFLDDVYLKIKDTLTSSSSSAVPALSSNKAAAAASSFLWLTREKMQDKLGFQMSLLEYRQIRQRLNKIAPAAQVSENVSELLGVFSRQQLQQLQQQQQRDLVNSELTALDSSLASKPQIDAFGRLTAVGKRKSSTAKVTIIPGTGECLVNGRPMVEYFPRYRDVFEISRPLAVTRQFGKFNIWALARGGGMTGQSGAIKLALARALAVYNPEWKVKLDAAGLLKRDKRQVERKKPGQEKARKKFTWVKR